MPRPAQRPVWVRRTAVSLALALGTAAILVLFQLLEPRTHLDFLSVVEAKLVDLRFRLRGTRRPSGDVVVVAIDGKSVEAIGRWPWSRSVHAALIDRLREWGATTVAFDVLFTEAEGVREAERLRGIGALLGPSEPSGSPVRAAIDAGLAEVQADHAFASAMQRTFDADRALPVLAFDFVFPEDLGHFRQAGNVLGAADEQVVLDVAAFLSRDRNAPVLRRSPPRLAVGIRPVVTEIARSCAAMGYSNPVYDPDGFLRRESMAVAYSPSLRETAERKGDLRQALLDPAARVQAFMPLAVAAVATHRRLRVDQVSLDLAAGSITLAGDDGAARVRHFDPADGTTLIDFYGPSQTFPTWPFVDVIRDQLSDGNGHRVDGAQAFRGKLVFVGATLPGLMDLFSTPFTARLPGVEKHANVAEGLLHGREVHRAADSDLAIALAALAAAVLVALAAGNLGPVGAFATIAGTGLAWLAATTLDFARNGMLWNWTVPGLTLLNGFALIAAYRQLTEERDKRRIRAVFSTYMAADAVEEILNNPERLKLGGEHRVCTIFFSDVVGFTTLSESLRDPADLISLMNRYLGRMTAIILAEDGMLDKYIGDAIMAIFGAPVVRPDHAARACRAALRNLEALEKLRAEFRAEGLPDIDCRIGLNTGDVIIGNLGSEVRMDYTALGDTVNVASRLEGANKIYGTRLLVGERTFAEAHREDPDLVFRPIDLIQVKGKNEPLEVHELVGRRGAIAAARLAALARYEEGLALYRKRDFFEAHAAFEEALFLEPGEGPSRVYSHRCRTFMLEPPPDAWNGVFEMKTK